MAMEAEYYTRMLRGTHVGEWNLGPNPQLLKLLFHENTWEQCWKTHCFAFFKNNAGAGKHA